MREYEVQVTRDDRWWMIRVPEIDGLTQARRVSEIVDMARSLIAVSTDLPLSEIAVIVEGIDVGDMGDVAAWAARVNWCRRTADEAVKRAQRESVDYAAALTKAGVSVRDIASLLHVSPQRVSQLTAMQP